MTITGEISGSALTKVGDGSLILSGSNNYAGGTTVLDGTLEIVAADALPPGGGLTIGAGAQSLFDAGASAGIEISGGPPMQAASDASVAYAVPEPGTLALLAVGVAAAGVACNRLKMPFLSAARVGPRLRGWKVGDILLDLECERH